MLYREIFPVCEIHTKQYTVWAECGILNVDITWCNH
jgi:hypothetical protein